MNNELLELKLKRAKRLRKRKAQKRTIAIIIAMSIMAGMGIWMAKALSDEVAYNATHDIPYGSITED